MKILEKKKVHILTQKALSSLMSWERERIEQYREYVARQVRCPPHPPPPSPRQADTHIAAPHVHRTVSIRQHTSHLASSYCYASSVLIRQHSSAYVSIRQHASHLASSYCYASCVLIRQHTSAYVSIRQHASHLASSYRMRHI